MFIIDKMCFYHSYDKAHDMTSDGIWVSSHKAKVAEDSNKLKCLIWTKARYFVISRLQMFLNIGGGGLVVEFWGKVFFKK